MHPTGSNAVAAPWRGYRWPLTTSAHQVMHTPAWHWPVAVLVVAVLFGVVDLNQVVAIDVGPLRVYGNDLIFALVCVLALYAYVGSRRRPVSHTLDGRTVLLAGAMFAVIALMMFSRDFVQSQGILGNIQALVRQLPYFLSLFLLLAFVSGERDLHMLLRIWFTVTAIGTAIVLLQSLQGTGDIFGGGPLDRLRVPPGPQITERYGLFSRSSFPITFAAVWCFFFCLTSLLQRPSARAAAGMLWFSAAWVLNMSRGLYVGIALAFFTCLLVLVAIRVLRPAAAVAGIATAAGALLVVSYFGLGGLDDAVVRRGASAWQEYRFNTGTWASRIDEADGYFALKPRGDELLLGMGYTGTRSGLDRPFLEFGPVDLLYRGGIIGAMMLAAVLLLYTRFAFRVARNAPRTLAACAGIATLCSIVSEIGHMPSANHFYYIYYAAVLGGAVAVTVAAQALSSGSTK